jgi:hypothetical protein
MDDIMILFHKLVVDLVSFDESQFGIFNDSEQVILRRIFKEDCQSSSLKLFSVLSPKQKERVTLWACERTSFSVNELINSLKKFTKYLEGLSYSTYPNTNTTMTYKSSKLTKKKKPSLLFKK